MFLKVVAQSSEHTDAETHTICLKRGFLPHDSSQQKMCDRFTAHKKHSDLWLFWIFMLSKVQWCLSEVVEYRELFRSDFFAVRNLLSSSVFESPPPKKTVSSKKVSSPSIDINL